MTDEVRPTEECQYCHPYVCQCEPFGSGKPIYQPCELSAGELAKAEAMVAPYNRFHSLPNPNTGELAPKSQTLKPYGKSGDGLIFDMIQGTDWHMYFCTEEDVAGINKKLQPLYDNQPPQKGWYGWITFNNARRQAYVLREMGDRLTIHVVGISRTEFECDRSDFTTDPSAFCWEGHGGDEAETATVIQGLRQA